MYAFTVEEYNVNIHSRQIVSCRWHDSKRTLELHILKRSLYLKLLLKVLLPHNSVAIRKWQKEKLKVWDMKKTMKFKKTKEKNTVWNHIILHDEIWKWILCKLNEENYFKWLLEHKKLQFAVKKL